MPTRCRDSLPTRAAIYGQHAHQGKVTAEGLTELAILTPVHDIILSGYLMCLCSLPIELKEQELRVLNLG